MSKTSQQQTTDEIAKAKVQLHLRLTYEDWKETFKQLRTRSEIGVFYAIRTLDPFGDRALDIDCTVLGDELGLHRTTVSDALKLLSEKKLIDLEITKARVKQKISNRRLTLLTLEENGSNQEKKEEKTMRAAALSDESPASQASPQPHSGGAALTDERPRTNQPPEPLPQADSKTPHTSSDYSDFIQTTTDKADAAAVEEICSNPSSPICQPTQEEVEAAHQEIARISPEIEINSQVKKLVLEFWANLPAAIAHTKKAVREPWCKNPTGILCKALKNPSEEAESAANEIKKELPKPNKEQRTQLQKLGKPAAVEMPDGLIAEAIDFGGGRVLPWWRALNIPFEQLQQP